MNARSILTMVSLLAVSVPASAGELEFIGVKPTAIFTKESTHVVVSAKPKRPLAGDEKLFLVEVDASGRTLKIIGEMNDTGRWGDTAKDDGYYSKKFQIYEKKGDQKRTFTVARQSGKSEIETAADRDPALLDREELVAVEILRRPNIFELVGRVWTKLTD